MNPYDLRLLKRQVPIRHVLAAHGLLASLRRVGSAALVGPCPLHRGDNPTAFRVELNRGLWNCLTACGGGDTVDLVCRILDCDYAEAARHMRRLSRQPETHPRATTLPVAKPGPAAVVPAPFQPFRHTIPLNPNVPFLQHTKRIAAATAARFEAGGSDRSALLRGTVAVRLHDFDGRPLGYCGRRLEPEDVARFGKWRFPRAFPKADVLFNAHRTDPRARRGLVVVEGPWAVLRLYQAGVPNTVALLGTRMSDTQASWLAQATAVMLLLDGDTAGRRAAQDIAKRLAPTVPVQIYKLPDGAEPEDLDDHQLASVVADSFISLLNPYPSTGASTEAT